MLDQVSDPRTRLRDLFWAMLVVALCFLSVFAQPSMAAQIVEVRDGDTAINRISVRDHTRLRVERGRVLDVIGDVYDAQKAPGGRILVLKDEEQGEVYIKPVPPASMRGMDGSLLPGPLTGTIPAIKLDVKTDRGTVGLPRPQPGVRRGSSVATPAGAGCQGDPGAMLSHPVAAHAAPAGSAATG